MQRYSRLTARFSAVALSLALPVVLFSCTPSDEEPTGAAGTGVTGTAGTGAAGTGAAGTTGVAGTTGSAGTNGAAGTGAAGTNGAAGTGAAGTTGVAGTGGGVPTCKAGTPTNTAALTLKRTDIGARKVATMPAANITKMDWDPVNHVIVIASKGGKFWKIDPAAAAPAFTATEAGFTFGGDLRGMVFAKDGTLYVERGGNINVTIHKGTPGATRTWSTIVTSDSYTAGGTNFDHNYSGLAISDDGMYLFIGSGSRTDHGEPEGGTREVPLSSAILRVPTNATTVLKNDEAMLKTGGYLYADGTRNPFDMAFNANGDLIACDNGPDMDLPDELNWIQEGKHYGFPWRFGGEDNPVRDPAYTWMNDNRLHTGYMAHDIKSYNGDAAFPAVPGGVTFVDPILNKGPAAALYRVGKTGPVVDGGTMPTGMPGITGHRSPLGIAFDRTGALCGDFYKAGIVASFGSLPQSGFVDQGNDLLLIQMTKNAAGTNYEMKATQIATGFTQLMDGIMVGNKYYTVSLSGTSFMYEITLPTP